MPEALYVAALIRALFSLKMTDFNLPINTVAREKVKRSQRFGIHPRLDWWMRIKQPDVTFLQFCGWEFWCKERHHEYQQIWTSV